MSRRALFLWVSRPVSAFTLVELLVVTAVLALLLLLGGAAFQRAISSANTSVCSTNLRQIYAAYQAYAADNNGNWPYLSGSNHNYAYALREYIPNVGAYGKPLTNRKGPYICPALVRLNSKAFLGTCYGLNKYLHQDLKKEKTEQIPSLSIPQPARTIMLADGCWMTSSDHIFADLTVQRYPGLWWEAPAQEKPQHAKGAANIMFCDGHIEYWPDTSLLRDSRYSSRGPDDLWHIDK